MTACSSIITSFIYLSAILQLSPGYEVFQPENLTINPDGSAIISCEHNAKNGSILDARLSSVAGGKTRLLCQMGKKHCKDIVMYNEITTKYFFILLNIRPEEFKPKYQCEFTMEIYGGHVTERGTPTQLLPCEKEPNSRPQPQAPPQCDVHRWTLLEFILIGLLALTLLYSCVFTWYHIRQRGDVNITDPENSTYVEMRKAPLPRNHAGGNVNYAEVRRKTRSR